MDFEGFPFVVGWELTLQCNLRCRHCGSSAGLPRENELSLDEALAICDQFPALLVQEVDFTGGEPLLRPDWWKIASRLRALGIATKVITNGISLSDAVIERIQDSGIRGVGISVDGLAETHENIRGHHGLFARVEAGIEKLQKANIPLTILTTVNALNIHELPAVFNWLRAWGIRNWQIQPIFHFGRFHESDNLRLSQSEYLQLGMFIKETWSTAEQIGLRMGPADSFGYFTDLDPRQPPWNGCPAGLLSCGITSDGRVKGCLSMPDELTVGDLRKNDLWDIWFHPDSFAFTRKFRVEDLGPNCQGCAMAEQCQCGCSSMSYGCTGSFHNDPYCFFRLKNMWN
jgi:radical SAM protein with 4Fe4S-binding SPASM domain